MNRRDRRAGRAQSPPAAWRSGLSADTLFNAACEHHGAGRLAEAERDYRNALDIEPQHADSLNGLGILAHQCGHSDDAIALIGQAISLNGHVAQFHYNIALVFAAVGRMSEAERHNRRAIALKPDYANAHTNLAGALSAQGKLDEAAVHFRHALARTPDVPAAYANLANALLANGEPEEALSVVVRGLSVQDNEEMKVLFVRCVEDMQFVPKVPGLVPVLDLALKESWGPPEMFSSVVTAILKQNGTVAAPSKDSRAVQSLEVLAKDHLLQYLIVSMPIRDVSLERLLTESRRELLRLAMAGPAVASESVLAFGCALAEQCFINEYVFTSGHEEQEGARALRDRLAALLTSEDAVPPLMVAAVAAYFPLGSLDVSPGCFERPWPEAVNRLIVQQVREPAEEQALRSAIPALTPVDDDVSVLVRQQYEENPYPRWTATSSIIAPLTFAQNMRLQFPHATFAENGDANVEILIAGCGTGRHPIDRARTYTDANILAIDLSLASLSYAKRKARGFGLTNLAFGQADILHLGRLGRTFDVIEAVGVLHHLRDPREGWASLINLLRPGGYMRIGLYSALARQHINAARDFIAARGYGSTADAIRQCRQDILALDDGSLAKEASLSPDFFTVSACRDLLFHVQEHLTTIPAIKSLLAENDLTFIGFTGPMRDRYAKLHPGDTAMTDLDAWHAFETEHPGEFAGMYNFWIQKPRP